MLVTADTSRRWVWCGLAQQKERPAHKAKQQCQSQNVRKSSGTDKLHCSPVVAFATEAFDETVDRVTTHQLVILDFIDVVLTCRKIDILIIQK